MSAAVEQIATRMQPAVQDRVPVAEPDGSRFARRAETAAFVAASQADHVDRAACFPTEAIAAIRAERLLGIMLPTELGGEDATLSDVVEICYRLGQSCSSTAMIYAMHQACVACALNHSTGSEWHQAFLRRLAAEQMLLASSTTEGQAGGNVRSSASPVERTATGIRLERAATVVSYGAQADAIVTTARRSATSASSDQVLVTFLRDDYVLEPTVHWDTLGMRGTCSTGFNLKAEGLAEQVLPQPYEQIHPQSMVPVSHLAWAGVWAGIAAAAAERARAFTRRAARQAQAQAKGASPALPPGAQHATRALASLHSLRGLIAASLREYEQRVHNRAALMAVDFQTRMNLTKVEASERAVAITLEAGRACGLSGYRNDSEFSVGRMLRDALSSPIMINNDRILSNIATSSLLAPVPASLLND